MYCRKCGQEMQNDSNFCGHCGTSVIETPQPAFHESNIPVLTLKPIFIPWAAMVSILPIHIFMTIWGGGFFGGPEIEGLALPRDVLFLIDEAYAEFVDTDDYPNTLEYLIKGRRVCIMRTMSKTLGLAGVRRLPA